MSRNLKNMTMISILILVFVLGSCNDEADGYDEFTEDTAHIPVEDPVEEIDDHLKTDEPTTIHDEDVSTSVNGYQIKEPVVFCGDDAQPEDATVLTEAQALSYLVLVNRCYRVSNEFTPPDLTVVNVATVNPPFGSEVHHLRESAALATEALFQAAAAENLFLLMSSGYRSYDLQTFFHNQAVTNHGLEAGRRMSAVPGHSEHQLGLGVDLTTHALEGDNWLSERFSTTPEGVWVRANAHRFGFIISYPSGREADTGFIYEPWHIRYVGVDVATEIFNAGYILEEFLWYHRSNCYYSQSDQA